MKGSKICLWFLVNSTIILFWGSASSVNSQAVDIYSYLDPCKDRDFQCSHDERGSGGVSGRRRCVGKLYFYQGEEIVQEI